MPCAGHFLALIGVLNIVSGLRARKTLNAASSGYWHSSYRCQTGCRYFLAGFHVDAREKGCLVSEEYKKGFDFETFYGLN